MIAQSPLPANSQRREKILKFGIFFVSIYLYLFYFVGRFPAFTASIIWGGGLLVALVIGSIYLRYPLHFPLEVFFFVYFLIWSLTGGFFSENFHTFMYWFRISLEVFILFIIIYYITAKSGKAVWLITALGATALSNVIYCIYTGQLKNLMPSGKIGRLAGLMGNPNGLAWLFVLGLICCSYFLLGRYSRRIKFALLPALVLLLSGLFATAARAGFLAFSLFVLLCSISVLRIANIRQFNKILIFFIISLTMYLAVPYVMKNTYLGHRFKGIAQKEAREGGRISLYDNAFHVFTSNPVLGIGFGQFQEISSSRLYTHSLYLELLVSTGLPGAFFFLGVFILSLRRMRRALKVLARTEEAWALEWGINATLAFLFAGIFNPLFLDPLIMSAFAIPAGYAKYLEDRVKAQKNLPSSPSRNALSGSA